MHYLVMLPGFYAEGTRLGIFDTFEDARGCAESSQHWTAAEVELWKGSRHLATYTRSRDKTLWTVQLHRAN